MALIVETGTGASTSESYRTVAQWKTYATARGYDYSAYDDTTLIEQALRRGTAHIDTYEPRFPGLRLNLRSQALAWPRAGAYDVVGNAIDSDEIPVEIANATNEAAWRELVTPGSLNPDIAAGGRVLRRVKAGDTEVEYQVNSNPSKVFGAISTALAPLIGSTSMYSGRTARA